MFVSGLGCWEMGLVTPALDLSPWSWAFGPASFLMTNHICFWTWILGDGTCHSSTGLVTLKLSLMRNYVCFWTWMLGDGTCHSSIGLVTLKLGLRPSLILKERRHCFWTWMLGHWTCHSSIGLVILKLGLRPSFILNEKLLLFLEFDVGRWDSSQQRWTCNFEAGSATQLHS